MRNLFLLLIVLVIAAIVALQSGLVSIRQTRPATAPTLERSGTQVTAQPGQAPAFDVETGSIGIGQHSRTVTVPTPTVTVNRAGSTPATNSVPAQ